MISKYFLNLGRTLRHHKGIIWNEVTWLLYTCMKVFLYFLHKELGESGEITHAKLFLKHTLGMNECRAMYF